MLEAPLGLEPKTKWIKTIYANQLHHGANCTEGTSIQGQEKSRIHTPRGFGLRRLSRHLGLAADAEAVLFACPADSWRSRQESNLRLGLSQGLSMRLSGHHNDAFAFRPRSGFAERPIIMALVSAWEPDLKPCSCLLPREHIQLSGAPYGNRTRVSRIPASALSFMSGACRPFTPLSPVGLTYCPVLFPF